MNTPPQAPAGEAGLPALHRDDAGSARKAPRSHRHHGRPALRWLKTSLRTALSWRDDIDQSG